MSEDTKCPTCGRDDFKNRWGMKIHHKRVHGESIAGVEKECERCGDSFTAQPNKASGARFCSGECSADWRSSNVRGENHHAYSKVELVCENCEENYRVKKNRASEARFCSNMCWSLYYRVGNGHNPGHPKKDGVGPYGPLWTEELREYIRETQNRQCADCGAVDTFLPYRLHVHHIRPVRECDNPLIRNQIWNLVALCSSCHRHWEYKREEKQRAEFGKYHTHAGWPKDDEPFAGFDSEAARASGWHAELAG